MGSKSKLTNKKKSTKNPLFQQNSLMNQKKHKKLKNPNPTLRFFPNDVSCTFSVVFKCYQISLFSKLPITLGVSHNLKKIS